MFPGLTLVAVVPGAYICGICGSLKVVWRGLVLYLWDDALPPFTRFTLEKETARQRALQNASSESAGRIITGVV